MNEKKTYIKDRYLEIVDYPLTKNQYHDEVQPKRIIVLHHTAGGTAKSSINWWQQTKEKVGTAFVIDRDGIVYQAFQPDRWASALGIKQAAFTKYNIPNINVRLDQISVQIELANYGGLVKKNGKYYTYVDSIIPESLVTQYKKPFRGFLYYEKYTPVQIESLRRLILHMNDRFPSIKLDYNMDMWDVSKKALVGTWGIWTHASFRSDKNDCHPQPELITMLQNLK